MGQFPRMQTTHMQDVERWVDGMVDLARPAKVVWCDGSEEERERLTTECLASGELIALDPVKLPGCTLHRSHPHDVARTEQVTYICARTREDAGPTNNWLDPGEARQRLRGLFDGAMKGRTMYVVPFVMGPVKSPYSKVGVQVTDSRYVVLNLRTLTRMGSAAWDRLARTGEFTRCAHALGDLSPEKRIIAHFPEDNEIWSFASGYGGNALLSKKCMALRVASHLGRVQGWMAEHMLIVGIQAPGGETHYVAGAFPSASGKTNLAMLRPPRHFEGWKIWTVGDDIAWLHPGPDGRLWAINPEAGFFGVVPGTNSKTNPNAMATIGRNTIYTNVARRKDNTVWWEGHDDPPEPMEDWQGRPWVPGGEKAAHPNSRFTAPASQCPSISPFWEAPQGVPISAILFGARRQKVVPLVFESRDWAHGTFLGATLSTETTAAAAGKVGVLRFDSMAMQPFCGYNMADYWGHWLAMGQRLTRPPRIFRVNWFRTGEDGKFLWPGFGDNLRVIQWILDRCEGRGAVEESPLGLMPKKDALDLSGLNIGERELRELFRVDRQEWKEALGRQRGYFEQFGARVPAPIWAEHHALEKRIEGLP